MRGGEEGWQTQVPLASQSGPRDSGCFLIEDMRKQWPR